MLLEVYTIPHFKHQFPPLYNKKREGMFPSLSNPRCNTEDRKKELEPVWLLGRNNRP